MVVAVRIFSIVELQFFGIMLSVQHEVDVHNKILCGVLQWGLNTGQVSEDLQWHPCFNWLELWAKFLLPKSFCFVLYEATHYSPALFNLFIAQGKPLKPLNPTS